MKLTKKITGYFFVSPWIIGFTLFIFYPLCLIGYYSFVSYDVVSPPSWIGLGNYRELLQDPLFWMSFYNTAYYLGVIIPLGLGLALGIALLLNQKIKGLAVYRTIYFLPSITPIVSTAILWVWILNPQFGMINDLLWKLGISFQPQWLASPVWSKPSIVLMRIWMLGTMMIIFLAGLQDIPQQFYEAAKIDGATSWSQFLHITLPILTPTIFFNLVINFIFTSQIFTEPYVMTQGGPAESTYSLVLLAYESGFSFYRMGYACSIIIVLMGVILILTLILVTTSTRWVHYER